MYPDECLVSLESTGGCAMIIRRQAIGTIQPLLQSRAVRNNTIHLQGALLADQSSPGHWAAQAGTLCRRLVQRSKHSTFLRPLLRMDIVSPPRAVLKADLYSFIKCWLSGLSCEEVWPPLRGQKLQIINTILHFRVSSSLDRS